MQVFSHPTTSKALQGLQSNLAAKLLFVNIATMAVPRTIIDYKRNKYAGQETGFYESYSLLTNFILPGVLALGTATVLKNYKNPLKIDTTRWIGNDSINALSQHYAHALDAGKTEAERAPAATRMRFLKQVFSHLEAERAVDGHLARLKPEEAERFAHELEALPPGNKPAQDIADRLSRTLGSFDQIKLRSVHESAKALAIQPKKFAEHLSQLSHEFQKVGSSEQVHAMAGKMRFANHAKAAVGLSIVASLGFMAQFINKWITKERTGETGFVGTSNLAKPKKARKKAEHDKLDPTPTEPEFHYGPNYAQSAYQPQKITKAKKQDNQQQQPSFGGLASSQFLPTAEQLKYVIYPAGIAGKMLASRSIDELRETAIKAGFAYFNLLFIPNLVENAVAHAAGNPHIFSKKANLTPLPENSGAWAKTKQYFKTVNQSTVRSYEDMEIFAKQYGQKLSTANETELAKELKNLVRKPDSLLGELKNIPAAADREKHLTEAVMKQLRGVKNKAVLAGIFYSALTLGVGLNLLNIYITNRKYKKANSTTEQETVIRGSSGTVLYGAQPASNPFNTQPVKIQDRMQAFKTPAPQATAANS